MPEYWCSGHGGLINEQELRELSHIGRMCKICGSGRVVPVDPKPKEKKDD